MTFCDFETTTSGKWILAGEHAVIRGYAALLFPVAEKTLQLRYIAKKQPVTLDCRGAHGHSMQDLFWYVLEYALSRLGYAVHDVVGSFILENGIPIGTGMGASAALCVAIARWLVAQTFLSVADLYIFARDLEHLFHGKSSGLDIAGVSATSGIYFQSGTWSALEQAWQPNWRLSFCGQVSRTSACIEVVDALWQRDARRAATIDAQMAESVAQAKQALMVEDPTTLSLLSDAIDKACDCFYQWGLVSEPLQQHMDALRAEGALAVKPTGSGSGGYVLSLWTFPV